MTDEAIIEKGTEAHDDELVQNRTPIYEEVMSGPQKKLNEALRAGIKEIDGHSVMKDTKGRYIDIAMVRPADKLEDETVRKLMHFANELSDQITRFKGHAFEDVGEFIDLLKQEYGAERGGEKGNTTLTSYDGCLRVNISVADLVEFGPEIGVAKSLFDECVSAWAVDSGPEIRTIITRAFSMEGGKYNRAELFSLLRLDIDDKKWVAAKSALQSAIRTIGTKEYIRFQRRENAQAKWHNITIDLAKA